MRNVLMKISLVVMASVLAACSSMQGVSTAPTTSAATEQEQMRNEVVGKTVDQAGKETSVNITMQGGGDIGLKSMNAADKTKMSRALDAATGKATHWQNGATGIEYTVTPVRKVVIEGNPFCREYQVLVEKDQYKKEFHGTACVTKDGAWHTI